ncbi:MAG: glycoside hydrolase family 3 C-terminal domain-containing protein [Croceibacterium sp.]
MKSALTVGAAALAVLSVGPATAQTSAAAATWGTQGKDCVAPAGVAAPWRDRRLTPECRARFALGQFRTLDEKLRFLAPPPAALPADGRDVGAELGIPRIAGSDGPAGLVQGGASATALPSPLTVAASFDPRVAALYGSVLAREFRAAGLGTILGPAYDIARSWKFGRLSESMGEDPFLTATMAGAEVRALSDGGVMATIKHYAAYGQEAGRVGDQPSGSGPTGNNVVSEKALREIYLPGFEAAVKRGGAGAAMCSFPRINGVYACENPFLFDVLKREWGFDGAVMPDFPSAQRSITRAVLAGLDSGAASATPFDAALAHEKPLRQAVLDGEVPEARVDDMILRRLIPLFRLGLYDNPPVKQAGEASTPENRAAAADMLAAGSVLLKNERGILPFGPKVKSVAVIGLNASAAASAVEQGSPYVKPTHFAPALAAIEQRAGSGVRVAYAPGTLGLGALPPVDPRQVAAPGGRAGFLAEYIANPNLDFSGPPLASVVVADPSLGKTPDVLGLPGANQWSVRYTARFTPMVSGVHRFTLHGSGTARLMVAGVERGFELADFGNAAFVNVALTAGKPVDLRIEYTPRSALRPERMALFGMEMGLTLRFGMAPPDRLIAEAVAAARRADVAVVFAGERVGEGMDRQYLALQGDQDALIEAVAVANPNTVVVLSTGGPVAMPWLPRVRGVLETWLPGDAFGPALAGMLFGDREPGGRLPVTFPTDETQGPTAQRHQFPGLSDPATGQPAESYFEEGVNVGYRYYDVHRQAPLFAFGHGLGYGEAQIDRVSVNAAPDGTASVHLRVTNRGPRSATVVPQVYLGFPPGTGEPPKQLKGFAKVQLAPGEAREIDIPLAREAFRHWDEGTPGWQVSPGPYRVLVGRSAEDIAWEGQVLLPSG